jgi:hypothetical protein
MPVPRAATPDLDPSFDFALRTFAQPVRTESAPLPIAAHAGPKQMVEAMPLPQITIGVIVPEEEPVQTAAFKGGVPDEKPRTLRGRLEPGLERGTWNLRYEPEPGMQLPGGVVKLVAPQPLCGCHAGWEAQVEGHLTLFGWETAFQVESLLVIPPPVQQAQLAAPKEGPPAPGALRRSLVGRLEPGMERGTWNLLYYSDMVSNRPLGVLRLVADQPLNGLREGREVQVEGYVTWVGLEPVFQVESLALRPHQGGALTGAAR